MELGKNQGPVVKNTMGNSAEADVIELREMYLAEKAELKNHFQSKLKFLKADYESKILELKMEYQRRIKDIGRKYDENIKNLKDEVEYLKEFSQAQRMMLEDAINYSLKESNKN
ncbi:MAG: hypothetical protein AAF363_08580 [Bacteroidota bacterium]